jgi:membrane-bound lytic murein transglycosylase D
MPSRIHHAAGALAFATCFAALTGSIGIANAQPAPTATAAPSSKPSAAAKPPPAPGAPAAKPTAAAKPADHPPKAAPPKGAEPEAPPSDAAKGAPAPAKTAGPKTAAPPKQATKGGAGADPRSAKAQPKPGKKPGKKVAARKPGSDPGEPNEATRRIIAGTQSDPGKSRTGESPELRAMRELDLALFPASPGSGPPWPADGTLPLDRGQPQLFTSGMPPAGELAPPRSPDPVIDLSWLKQLNMPDIPVRWDARVVRYLEYYKNDPRGRSMVAGIIKKSGRYAAAIRKTLREQGLPEDILWLSLVESGFDPTISSPVGAAGLWQFMPEGARIYGLTVDRWIDERLDPERSTLAAARYLADLRQRFGGWELAFAAYNMGYGGLLASIRKYNTNDYWELSRFEAGIPLETALYVPKIVAMAIVARNKAVFGCDDVDLDPAINFDKVAVGSGISVKTVASASGVAVSEIEQLNPQIRATRTPPLAIGAKGEVSWVVRVPPGAGARAAKSIPKLVEQEGKLERYLVRWGESLDDIAAFRRTTKSSLQGLNGLRRDEVVRPGTVLFVPAAAGIGAAAAENLVAEGPAIRPIVIVPSQAFSYPDRRRVFYRVIPGDTLRDVANVFSVTADELCRWNGADPGAALHEGMTLQIYLPKSATPKGVLALDETDARVLAAGSPEFFAHFEALKGRKRVEMVAREGDSWRSVAKQHGLTIGMMERINQRVRTSPLHAGERYVVYVPSSRDVKPAPSEPAISDDVAVTASNPDAAVKEEDPVKPAVFAEPTVEGSSASPAAGGDSVATTSQ